MWMLEFHLFLALGGASCRAKIQGYSAFHSLISCFCTIKGSLKHRNSEENKPKCWKLLLPLQHRNPRHTPELWERTGRGLQAVPMGALPGICPAKMGRRAVMVGDDGQLPSANLPCPALCCEGFQGTRLLCSSSPACLLGVGALASTAGSASYCLSRCLFCLSGAALASPSRILPGQRSAALPVTQAAEDRAGFASPLAGGTAVFKIIFFIILVKVICHGVKLS